MPDSLVFKSVTLLLSNAKMVSKARVPLKKKKKHVYLVTSEEDNMEGG